MNLRPEHSKASCILFIGFPKWPEPGPTPSYDTNSGSSMQRFTWAIGLVLRLFWGLVSLVREHGIDHFGGFRACLNG